MLRSVVRQTSRRAAVWTPARALKQTTRIVGLPVEPNAPELLRRVYREQLKAAEALPESFYRSEVETHARARLALLERCGDDAAKFEAQLDRGEQIEQTLAAEHAQLELLPRMAERRSLDNVDAGAVEIVELPPGVHSKETLRRAAPTADADAAAAEQAKA